MFLELAGFRKSRWRIRRTTDEEWRERVSAEADVFSLGRIGKELVSLRRTISVFCRDNT